MRVYEAFLWKETCEQYHVIEKTGQGCPVNLEFENRGKESKFDKMGWVTEGLI